MGGALIIAFYYSQGITGTTVYILLGVAFLFAFAARRERPCCSGWKTIR